MTRIGVQLHTFRDVDDEYPEILGRVAESGYAGIEFAHEIHHADTQSVAAVLSETGLEPVGAHVELAYLEEEFDSLVDQYETLGCSSIVIPHVSGTWFLTADRVDELARRLNDVAARLDDRGFELVVHNTKAMHRPLVDTYGFGRVVESDVVPTGGAIHAASVMNLMLPGRFRGQTGFGRLLAATDGVGFEIDLEHAVGTGRDPLRLFAAAGDRLFAVHISDGTRTRTLPPAHRSTSLGDGSVDIERYVREAIECDVEWLIGEVDDPPDPALAFDSIIDRIEDSDPRAQPVH
jgi:sugar phosphate isomerase/epimerase